MTPEEFRKEHAKWKGDKTQVIDNEPLRTWLMSKSGYYFPYEGREVFKSELGKEMLCIFFNETSFSMRVEQEKVIANRQREK